ncbi:MAG: hypothetical protein AAF570_06410 [Bacteroidota bacterium]
MHITFTFFRPSHILFAALLCSFTLFSSCNSESSDASADSKAPKDSAQTSDPGLHTVPQKSSFGDRILGYVEAILPDFKETKTEPMDAFPKFPKANRAIYKRMQSRKPVATKITKAAYPRLTIKAFSFRDSAALVSDLEAWLNKQPKSTDDFLSLGMEVDSIKTPPALIAVFESTFWMIQYGCVYNGPAWDEAMQRFFTQMKAEKARYVFEVECSSGALRYH